MNTNKNFLITLTGPSGSGKTTIEKLLINNRGFKRAISHTTRPMRINEQHGVDYYYVDNSIMEKLYNEGKLAEYIEYNGYKYGVSIDELMMSQVIAIEPHGLMQVKEVMKDKKEIISIFLQVSPEEAEKRMLSRGDQPSNVKARLDKDSSHFNTDLSNYDYIINTDNGKISDIYEVIDMLIKSNVDKILERTDNCNG